jgi:hypothetical protein
MLLAFDIGKSKERRSTSILGPFHRKRFSFSQQG